MSDGYDIETVRREWIIPTARVQAATTDIVYTTGCTRAAVCRLLTDWHGRTGGCAG